MACVFSKLLDFTDEHNDKDAIITIITQLLKAKFSISLGDFIEDKVVYRKLNYYSK